MKLKIKPFSKIVKKYYLNHGHVHDGDAGLDLFIINDQTINSGDSAKIHLQISCENLESKPFFLMARSSISKTPLRLSNAVGLIDGGYRGEIIAAVDNIKTDPFTLKSGQRLFQIVAMDGSPIELEVVDTLSETERGSSGFGSTGV